VRPFLVITPYQGLKIVLQFGNRAVDLLAECYTIELVQHRLVKALNDAIRLRAFVLVLE
jgi:hypothetical protein